MTDPSLRVRGLRKAYREIRAVDGLDLDVRAGECFGLLGPNGAGKTTIVEICEGLQPADSGEVLVLGLSWQQAEPELRERTGVALQETQLSEKLTVRETLTLFRSFYRRGRPVNAVLELMQLGEKAGSRVGQLSGGQRQRLALACGLVGDPELLFLDEPTTGLDPQARRQVWDIVTRFRGEGRSLVLTTHYMEEAERLCDRVAIIDHGRIIALGTPRELVAALGAEQVVEFIAAPGPVTSSWLRELPGVLAVDQDGLGCRLRVTHPHQTLPALLDWLRAGGLELSELRTHTPTLEDVFVSLTGRHLRDG